MKWTVIWKYLQQAHDRTPAIFRTELSTETGAVVNEQRIHKIPRKIGSMLERFTGRYLDYQVVKDQFSNHYAVLVYNDLAREGTFRYLPADKSLHLLIYKQDGTKKKSHVGYHNYDLLYSRMNTQDFKTATSKISQDELTVYSNACCADRNDFIDTPVDFIVNPDNTLSLLFEERVTISSPPVPGFKLATTSFGAENIGILITLQEKIKARFA